MHARGVHVYLTWIQDFFQKCEFASVKCSFLGRLVDMLSKEHIV